ncbi:MAG: TIR domain-containing protein [Thiolinea sp.]
MKKAFISYRRQDSAGHVRAIHDRLRQHFHPDQIFMDVEDIPLGTDFVTVLDSNLQDCVIMLVMIGPDWLDIRSSNGKRRLDNPNDFVLLEIHQALKRNIGIIPILVDGAPMPTEADLPDVLKPLARRQALELDNKHYDSGIQTLIESMEKHLGKPIRPTPKPAPITTPNRLPLFLSFGFLLMLAGVVLYFMADTNSENPVINEPVQDQQHTTKLPTATAGFDCRNTRTDVEEIICNDDQTRQSDQRLNQIYQKLALSIPPHARQKLQQRQLNWLRQRNQHIRQNCLTQSNHRLIIRCVDNYYQQRISTLSRIPTETLSRVRIADPPSNIRQQPNGDIICQANAKQMIEVYNRATREEDGDKWYWTRFCGNTNWGVIHESQISTVN